MMENINLNMQIEWANRAIQQIKALGAGLPAAQAEELAVALNEISALTAALHRSHPAGVGQGEPPTAEGQEEELFKAQQMLELVLGSIPQRVFWKDRRLRYQGCNAAFARDAGLELPEQVAGKTDHDLPWGANAADFNADDQGVLEKNLPKLDYEERAPRSDGGQLWVRSNKIPLRDRQGNVTGLLGTYDDITERKMAEEELQRANEKLIVWVAELEMRNRVADLLRQMDDLMQVCDVSEEAYAVIGQFCPQLFPNTSGAMYLSEENRRLFKAAVVWGGDLHSEEVFPPEDCWALRRGQIHSVSEAAAGLRCRHVPEGFAGDYTGFPMSAAGEIQGLLHVENVQRIETGQNLEDLIRTVGEHLSLSLSNLKLRETLRSQSVRDPLSGLFNRHYMEESLGREISRAQRKGANLGLILLDIDHFKRYNDTFGHDAGDAVLRELGAFLKAHIRTEDIACRFGGEEFILIMPDASLEITQQRAEKIRTAASEMGVVYKRQSLAGITLSAGVAAIHEHGSNPDELVKAADQALRQAKQNGRNRVESA